MGVFGNLAGEIGKGFVSVGSRIITGSGQTGLQKAGLNIAKLSGSVVVKPGQKLASGVTSNVGGDLTGKTLKNAASDLTGDAAGDAARNLAGDAAGDLTGKTLKNEATDAAGDAAGKTLKKETAENTGDAAGKTGKEAAEETTEEAAKKGGLLKTIKDNKLTIAAGVVGTGIGIKSYVDMQKKEAIVFKINSIKNNTAKSIFTSSLTAVIKYTPSTQMSIRDTVNLKDTNSIPALAGEYRIANVNSDSEIVIVISEKIETDGTDGSMNVNTNFGTQFGQNLGGIGGDVAAGAVGAGADVLAGAAVPLGETLAGAVGPLGDLLKGLGGMGGDLAGGLGKLLGDFLVGIFGGFDNFIMIIVVIIASMMLFSIIKAKIVSSV